MRNTVIIFIMIFLMSVPVWGSEDESVVFRQYIDSFDFDDINGYSNESVGMSFEELIEYIVFNSGDISFASALDRIVKSIFSEIYDNSHMMKNLIIICILSGIIYTIASSLKDSSIAQMGFYINYIMVANLLFTSFYISLDLLKNVIHSILDIIRAGMPLVVGVMISGGNSASALAYNSIMLMAVELLGEFVDKMVVPFLTFSVIVQILNCLMEKEVLSKMAELFKQLCVWGLRGVAIVFMAMVSFYRISTPILNTVVNKTAKTAVGMLPVVGDVFSGSVDMALYFINALKSGLGLGIVVVIIVGALLPIIKILAVMVIYKITAAIVQPIAESRISDVIDYMGGYIGIILSSLITVIFMFTFSIIVMLNTF